MLTTTRRLNTPDTPDTSPDSPEGDTDNPDSTAAAVVVAAV